MHKVAISGTWKQAPAQVERDVRRTVEAALDHGDGIVTGGALGVDFIATDEVLRRGDFEPEQLKVIIPSSLGVYSAHYRKRAEEGVITPDQAESLISQLEAVQDRGTLVQLGWPQLNQESYFARNTAVLEAADSLAAFQVNGSAGTQDTIDKARELGMPVDHHEYLIAT